MSVIYKPITRKIGDGLFLLPNLKGDENMFKQNDNCFITKRIALELPENLKLFCWRVIDSLVAKGEVKLDYFQIVEFEKGEARKKLIVTHRQEEPEYQRKYDLLLLEEYRNCSIEKVWVIDDGGTQTMLLPNEY